jgi:hypothetical protein
VTLATALVSLATGRAVRADVAMTGEVTLRGRVLAVGGVREKALAALRAGITQVIVPERNVPDLEEIRARRSADCVSSGRRWSRCSRRRRGRVAARAVARQPRQQPRSPSRRRRPSPMRNRASGFRSSVVSTQRSAQRRPNDLTSNNLTPGTVSLAC